MSTSKFQIYGLRETYVHLGENNVKVVIHPKYSKVCEEFDIKMLDSDRKDMKFNIERWGRKFNISFMLDNTVSDGIASLLINKNNTEFGKAHFWIIKP